MKYEAVELLNDEEVLKLYENVVASNYDYVSTTYTSSAMLWYVVCSDKRGYYTYRQGGCTRGDYCSDAQQCGKSSWTPSLSTYDVCIATYVCGSNRTGVVCCPAK